MKTLLKVHSVSYAESVRLALESEDIEAVLFDQFQPGFMHFAGRVRVMVVHDEDFPRAQEVLRQLEAQPDSPFRTPPPPSWKWQKRGLLAIGLGFLTCSVGGGLQAESGSRLGAAAILVGLLVVFGGVVLVFEARRADKQEPVAK